jgi:D-alanine transaminase/branched-chain amino acid aminotransferase
LVSDNNASDVLYQKNGVVSEFPRCNFFIVKKNGTVITPADNILLGVTRGHVLKLAAQHYDAQTGDISLDDIRHAREAFLTSTTKRIVPIVQVNDVTIGDGKPGPVTISLLNHLINLEAADRVRH